MSVKTKAPKVKKTVIVFDYKSLSADILAKRVKEDLSLRAIEAETGIPRHQIFSLEVGKQIPSCVNFAAVVTWLGKTANDYFVTKK